MNIYQQRAPVCEKQQIKVRRTKDERIPTAEEPQRHQFYICAFSNTQLSGIPIYYATYTTVPIALQNFAFNFIGRENKTNDFSRKRKFDFFRCLWVRKADERLKMKEDWGVPFILRLIILDSVLVLLLAATFGVESEFASLLAPANVFPERD